MFFYSGKDKDTLLVFDKAPLPSYGRGASECSVMAAVIREECEADLLLVAEDKLLMTGFKSEFQEIKTLLESYSTVVFSGNATASLWFSESLYTEMELAACTEMASMTMCSIVDACIKNVLPGSTKWKASSAVKSRKEPGTYTLTIKAITASDAINEGIALELIRHLEDTLSIHLTKPLTLKKKSAKSISTLGKKYSDLLYDIFYPPGHPEIRVGFTENVSFFHKVEKKKYTNRVFEELYSILKRDIAFIKYGQKSHPDEIYVSSLEELKKALLLVKPDGALLPVAFDIETTGIRCREAVDLSNKVNPLHPKGVQSFDPLDPFHSLHTIISCSAATETDKGVWFFIHPPRIKSNGPGEGFEMLRWLMACENAKVIANAKFELQWVSYYYKLPIRGRIYDILMQEHQLHEGMMFGTHRYSVEGITAMRLNIIPHKDEATKLIFTGWDSSNLPKAKDLTEDQVKVMADTARHITIPPRNKDFTLFNKEALGGYSVRDAVYTLRIFYSQMEEYKATGRHKAWMMLARDLVGKESSVLSEMESTGMPLDVSKVLSTIEDCNKLAESSFAELVSLFGDRSFNSATVLEEIVKTYYPQLYDSLEVLPDGSVDITKNARKKYAKDYPWLNTLSNFRHASKARGTYMLPFLSHASANRIYFDLFAAGPATGRLASREPNLQNVPANISGIPIKAVMGPEEGCVLLNIDLSNAEMRALGNYSKETALIKLFKDNLDAHSQTASLIFKEDYELIQRANNDDPELDAEKAKFLKGLRKKAKPVNFGIVYGITAIGLMAQTGCSKEEAQGIIDAYYTSHPYIKNFMDRLEQQVLRYGYVENLFGRRRSFPILKKWGSALPSFIVNKMKRKVCNFMIQSTTSDIFQWTLGRLQEMVRERQQRLRLSESGLIMHVTVHDSLVVSVRESILSVEELTDMLDDILFRQLPEKFPDFTAIPMTYDIEIEKYYGIGKKVTAEIRQHIKEAYWNSKTPYREYVDKELA